MLLIHNHFRQLSEFLLEEHVQVKKKSKLNLTEIYQFMELCLDKPCFLYNNVIWALENSESIRFISHGCLI